ncbi:hypothetical protein GCM10017621_23120 [Maricaulis virginensis]|uniref:Uncharacterized protein n=1 Tax=Maricaulis virginensis TaxID=144022 RepID=A0A9W6INK1_9PROT|nr:hypothetical protein GCM10017621_23120 [Maricaulis virginensis]
MRIFEEIALETLIFGRGRITEHAGEKSHTGLDENLGRAFATGQNGIADTDLFHPATVDDPLIEPFEPAAEYDNARTGRPLPDPGL